mmetsp:Transcript_39157/g.112601  ORF Transcript_39157/g.112601 Transcript_39157/m.112601 type:complete len:315 (+) Transcript_39157:135-1079(+)
MAAPGSYGAATLPPTGPEHPRFPAKRSALPRSGPGARLLRLGCAVLSVLLPCGVFAGMDICLSFGAGGAWLVVAGATIVVLLLGGLAAFAYRRRASLEQDVGWYFLLFLGTMVAWLLSLILGSTNAKGLSRYYDMISMATYVDVNPDVSGRQYVDAGRVLFEPGSYVDTSRAIAFKSTSTYCVAPITLRTADGTAAAHDFWAAGVDCCAGTGANFRCGDVLNKRAYAGMRVLDSDSRAFFRLAVQEAEAQYGIRAERPIFVEWMADPIGEITSLWETVGHRLLFQVLVFSAVQFFVVAATSVVLGRPKEEHYEN